MAPVAKEALDQLHTCDRANRKQYFYLNHLEPIKPGRDAMCEYTAMQLGVENLHREIKGCCSNVAVCAGPAT